MHRVVHFEIHASNPESLIPFYQQLFGWQFDAWGPPGYYWVIRTSPGEGTAGAGIDGGLVPRRGPAAAEGQSVNAFVCTIDVESAANSLARAVELGGTVAVPLMPIPDVGWLVYAKDPDGNIFGMMQNDPSAA
jgi:predicted enzyme related to lactoylglutathione lyase